MKRYILSILLLSFLLISPQSYSKKIKWKKETVAVSGNCNMCKNKIEEAALSVQGVKTAKWSSTNEKLKLKFDPAKTTLEDILKNIADIGYDSEKFIAKDEVYENLHYCCKYERKLKKK
jgi:mercuric ion binding protein